MTNWIAAHWQNLVAAGVLAWAAGYLALRAYRAVTRPQAACESCGLHGTAPRKRVREDRG